MHTCIKYKRRQFFNAIMLDILFITRNSRYMHRINVFVIYLCVCDSVFCFAF